MSRPLDALTIRRETKRRLQRVFSMCSVYMQCIFFAASNALFIFFRLLELLACCIFFLCQKYFCLILKTPVSYQHHGVGSMHVHVPLTPCLFLQAFIFDVLFQSDFEDNATNVTAAQEARKWRFYTCLLTCYWLGRLEMTFGVMLYGNAATSNLTLNKENTILNRLCEVQRKVIAATSEVSALAPICTEAALFLNKNRSQGQV